MHKSQKRKPQHLVLAEHNIDVVILEPRMRLLTETERRLDQTRGREWLSSADGPTPHCFLAASSCLIGSSSTSSALAKCGGACTVSRLTSCAADPLRTTSLTRSVTRIKNISKAFSSFSSALRIFAELKAADQNGRVPSFQQSLAFFAN